MNADTDEDVNLGGVEGHCGKCGRYCNNLIQCESCDKWVCQDCLWKEEPDEVLESGICTECAEDYSSELTPEEELADTIELMDLEEMERRQVQVMDSVLKIVKPKTFLKTPSGKAMFMIERVDPSGVLLRVGKTRAHIQVSADCLNGVSDFLESKGWVLIGAKHDQPSPEGSFDEYVKRFTHGISAASYVVPILERILLVQVDRREPQKIRLI